MTRQQDELVKPSLTHVFELAGGQVLARMDGKGNQMAERWSAVRGFSTWYDVSDQGRVRSWRNGKWGFRKEPVVLKQSAARKGYRRVTLQWDKRPHYRFVHRLVLEAFAGPCPEGHEVGHRNGIPDDNRLANLYWATSEENGQDRARHGRLKGSGHPNARLTDGQVRDIRRMAARGMTHRAIARAHRVSRQTIGRVVSGGGWSHVK